MNISVIQDLLGQYYRLATRNSVIVFFIGFIFLFIGRTFFVGLSSGAYFFFTLSFVVWIIVPVNLAFSKIAREMFPGKLLNSLWAILGLGILAIIFYVIQTDLVLGKYLMDAQYSDSRDTLQKVRRFFEIAYLVLLLSTAIFSAIFQASLEAVLSDSRRGSFLQSASINIGLLIILLITLNYAAKIRPATIDMTTLKKYSLSSQGRSIIKGIDRKVQVDAFFPFFHEYQREVSLMLDDIKSVNPLIEYRFIDAIKDKDVADEKKVSSNGVILFSSIDESEIDLLKRYPKRRLSVTTTDDLKKMEREFVSAILAVSRKRKKIYFTAGHGEYGYSGPFVEELISIYQDDLKHQSYEIDHLTPESGFPGAIPKDAGAVVIAGARRSFNKKERETLKKYLLGGGKVMLVLDPSFKTDFDFIFDSFGVKYTGKKVLSEVSWRNRRGVIAATTYSNHPITAKFSKFPEKSRFSLWAGAGYFDKIDKYTGDNSKYNIDFFVTSNFRSWIDKIRNNVQDVKKEPSNPFNLAMAISIKVEKKVPGKKLKKKPAKQNKLKLAAFSDSNFITNQYIGYGKNHEIAVNAVKWLLEDEKIMGILPNKWEEGRIKLSTGADDFVFYFISFLWPFMIALSGFFYLRLRKRRTSQSLHNKGV